MAIQAHAGAGARILQRRHAGFDIVGVGGAQGIVATSQAPAPP